MKLFDIVIILFIIVLITFNLAYQYYFPPRLEKFEHKNDIKKINTDAEINVEYYIITMKKPERIESINNQLQKINQTSKKQIHFNLIDAVVGKTLNRDELIQQKILSPNYKGGYGDDTNMTKNELGCYMSHSKVHELISKNPANGYSVVFEDDFNIVTDDFIENVENAVRKLKNEDFDMLYLGTNYDNHGKLFKDNVHHVDKGGSLFGAHAILYNNKNINKVIQLTKYIEVPVDVRYENLSYSDTIKTFVLFPHIVKQQFDKLASTIGVDGFSFMRSMLTPSASV